MAHDVKYNEAPARAESAAGPKELELKVRESEANAAQSRLERGERLAVLGFLVSEIAHEINTPLSALRSNNATLRLCIQRLRSLTGPAGGVKKEELEELFRTVDDIVGTNHLACERMSKIVQSLRGSPLLDEGEFVQVNPNREIESSLALLAHAFRNRIRLIKDYGDLPEIECDPGRIGQVFLNILINAVQAIEGEGEIRIRTWREGDTVRIAIRDNGKGIAAEFRSRIFDPGFTTKSVDSGTGLGLFICRRIVRQHGGRIDVESEERKGASFTITLPIRHTQERKTDDWRI